MPIAQEEQNNSFNLKLLLPQIALIFFITEIHVLLP